MSSTAASVPARRAGHVTGGPPGAERGLVRIEEHNTRRPQEDCIIFAGLIMTRGVPQAVVKT